MSSGLAASTAGEEPRQDSTGNLSDAGKRIASKDKYVFLVALISLVFFCLYKLIPSGAGTAKDQDMVRAAEIMACAIQALPGCILGKNTAIDPGTDINRTGLVGQESSPITTSLGQLEAKRTTTNPNFAGLIASLLKQAGVKRGDAVAVGASSSFPALAIASASAVSALEAKLVTICSLGASNWGATNPEFSLLEMLQCLHEKNVFDVRPIALALGGDIDNGSDMSEEGRTLLTQKIRASGIYFLQEPDLRANVQKRMRLYEESAAPARIKAFINIGGSWANMGTDSSVLKVKPGLTQVAEIPPPGKRGVIHEMALRKIPVIHLLYVKGLVERYGLPWDPVPLPRPGEGSLYIVSKKSVWPDLVLAGAYIAVMLAALAFFRCRF